MRPALLVIGSMRVLGRPEGDQDHELLLDVVEAMLDVRTDEHGRAGLDGVISSADLDAGPARDHVVDLVLGVRTLGIGATGREHVESHRQVVSPDELVVQATGLGARLEQEVQRESVHGSGA